MQSDRWFWFWLFVAFVAGWGAGCLSSVAFQGSDIDVHLLNWVWRFFVGPPC